MAELSPLVLRPVDAAGERPFRVARSEVDGPLGTVVRNFWTVEWTLPPGAVHDQQVLTDPAAHLTVEAGTAWVQGVVTAVFRRRLTGSGRVVGAKLHPAGLSALAGTTLVDRRVPAAELLGDVGDLVAAVAGRGGPAGMAALRDWCTARDPRRPAGAELVDDAVALAAAEPDLTRVAELAARLGVTVRTLQRRFDRHLGVGPKWVLQRCRIQDALAGIEAGADVDWAGLAGRLGFADQAHFVNTFSAVVGVPPGEYRRRPPLGDPTPALLDPARS